jgi:translocator protein
MKNWNSLLMLALLVGICLAVGGFGALFTSGSVREWYPMIRKPSWNPPSWVFGPVWTILYLIMGTAAWIVWCRRNEAEIKSALILFAVQLILNGAWSPLFFGLRNPLAGLLDIVPLWAAILATLILFWRISPTAGWLMTPYLLWVSFATALNFAIWKNNL